MILIDQTTRKREEDLKSLLVHGQNNQSLLDFLKRSPNYMKAGMWFFGIAFVTFLLVTVLLHYAYPSYSIIPKIITKEQLDGLLPEGTKIFLGVAGTYFLTVMVTNRWQQRSLSFEMLKELNSPEFHKVRCYLINTMKKAVAEGRDVEEMDGWLPFRTGK